MVFCRSLLSPFNSSSSRFVWCTRLNRSIRYKRRYQRRLPAVFLLASHLANGPCEPCNIVLQALYSCAFLLPKENDDVAVFVCFTAMLCTLERKLCINAFFYASCEPRVQNILCADKATFSAWGSAPWLFGVSAHRRDVKDTLCMPCASPVSRASFSCEFPSHEDSLNVMYSYVIILTNQHRRCVIVE